jgi:hypothetical protein
VKQLVQLKDVPSTVLPWAMPWDLPSLDCSLALQLGPRWVQLLALK